MRRKLIINTSSCSNMMNIRVVKNRGKMETEGWEVGEIGVKARVRMRIGRVGLRIQ